MRSEFQIDALDADTVGEPARLTGAGIAACCFLLSAALSGYGAVSLALVVAAVLVTLNEIVKSRRVQAGAWVAMPFLTYWLASGLLVGSVPPPSEIMTWLAHDGRALLALLPIVLLGAIRGTSRDLDVIVRLIRAVTWINLVAAVGLGAVGQGVIAGAASSHHALGFWSVGAAVVLGHHQRAMKQAVLSPVVLAAAATVVVSGSRSAILALAISLLWLAFHSQRFGQLIQILLALTVGFVLLVYSSERVKETVASVTDPSFRAELSSNFQLAHSQYEAGSNVVTSGSTTAEANIQRRAGTFGSATGRWWASPFVGIGSGRFNDKWNEYSGTKGVLYVATAGEIALDDSDAHNSYLQILAENGLIGAILLSAMFVRLWRRAKHSAAPMWASVASRQLIVVLLGTALAGHTIASPAATYPLLVLAGIVGGMTQFGRRASRSSDYSGLKS